MENQIADILQDLKDREARGTRKNSARKGKRGEKLLLTKLRERFDQPFVRVPQNLGSGGWATSHAEHLEENLLDMDNLAGDIIVPKGFKFVLECKFGYDIELLHLFPGSKRTRDGKYITSFLEQVRRDADRVNKQPVVIYHKDNCPMVVILEELPKIYDLPLIYFRTQEWICISLQHWLTYPDSYFFTTIENTNGTDTTAITEVRR